MRDTLALDAEHVIRPWSKQSTDESRLAISGGSGATLWDEDGREYLDFTSQLVYSNVGHGHPALIEAISTQAERLATIAPSHASDVRSRAAAMIAGIAPEGMSRIFFTNGGAEANENAIRMARDYTGRTKIISFYRSYHGATGSAINATGDWRRQRNEFGVGHVRVFGPYAYRSVFGSTNEQEESERSLNYLEQVILCEGPESIAALIIEPVVGSSGLLPPPPGYLEGVRRLTEQHGILLIFDEVMTGFGRTGHWFALEEYGVRPDLITFAKGVNSGYVPVGGVIVDDALAATWDDRRYPGGLTYSGHLLAMASVVANIQVLREDNLPERSKELGRRILAPYAKRIRDEIGIVGEVRGLGLLWAIELVTDRETRRAVDTERVSELAGLLRSRGVLVLAVENRIHIAPPLVIEDAQLKQGLEIIEQALSGFQITD